MICLLYSRDCYQETNMGILNWLSGIFRKSSGGRTAKKQVAYSPRPMAIPRNSRQEVPNTGVRMQSNTDIHPETVINPATGLLMVGGIAGIDVAGNTYGETHYTAQESSSFGNGDDFCINSQTEIMTDVVHTSCEPLNVGVDSGFGRDSAFDFGSNSFEQN